MAQNYQDTIISLFYINKLTKEQLNALPSHEPDQLYLVPEPEPLKQVDCNAYAPLDGEIVQHVGTTANGFTKGYVYQYTASGSVWARINVQPQQLSLDNNAVIFTDSLGNTYQLALASDIPSAASDTPIIFSEAASKANVASGDTLATLFGKIQKWFNTPTMKANSNYVTSGDKVVLTIKKSLIPYYQAACFMVSAMGNAYGSILLRVNHGDAWSATIDEITNTVALSVSSVDGSDTNNVVVKLSCGISGSNKYTFHPLSGVDIISISVELLS